MYGILQVFFTFFFRFFFSADAQNTKNVPTEGGVLLAANHLSNWDPPFLATFLHRPVSYMAKKELFDIPVFKQAILACHAFPVRRGAADRGAIKSAVQQLKNGACVGVFPEGTRSRDGKTHKAEAGIALLAAMAKVPVVPAAIIGTNQIFAHGKFFPKLAVVYGTPLCFEGNPKEKSDLEAFSQKIMEEIIKMKEFYSNPR